MFPSYPVGLYPSPITQAPSIDQKLGWARNYPVDHLSMGLIHFADLWFGLKTAPTSTISDEVRYQLFFAAHAYRKPDGNINFGENSGASFYIQGLKISDLVLLYRILHGYHQQEKAKKGDQAIFGNHLILIETHLKKLCSNDLPQGQEIIQAFLHQDQYDQVTEIRKRIETLMKELTSSPKATPEEIMRAALSRIPIEARISEKKMWRHVNWQTRDINDAQGKLKMLSNTLRSLIEHKRDNPLAPYIDSLELEAINDLPKPGKILTLAHSEFEAIGPRTTMEDTHFFLDGDHFAIGAVFDGHGGDAVAKKAKERFLPIFTEELLNAKKNILKAFEKTIIRIQNEIESDPTIKFQGATATIVFIDKKDHMAYTANLGDSEAKLYTTINGTNKIISLSCVRDWSSKFDATRVSILENDPTIVERYANTDNPKTLRLKNILNVSRALGDVYLKGTELVPGVTHKPKITMQRIPDPAIYGPSVIAIGCDGLWDYVAGSYLPLGIVTPLVKDPFREKELADIIGNHRDPSTLAEVIGKKALTDWDSRDNVSVLTIRIT